MEQLNQVDASRLSWKLRITTKQMIRSCILVGMLVCTMNGFWLIRFESKVIHRKNNLGVDFGVDDNSAHPVLYFDNNRNITNSVHVVLSHCNRSIDWVWKKYLKNFPRADSDENIYSIRSVTIVTKCGVPLKRQELPLFEVPHSSGSHRQQKLPVVSVLSLPNIGRCDHSYAYWIQSILSRSSNKESHKNNPIAEHTVLYRNFDGDDDPLQRIAADIDKKDLVLFMKDNDNAYRRIIEERILPLKMFQQALFKTRPESTNIAPISFQDAQSYTSHTRGFVCAGLLKHHRLNWAHRPILWNSFMQDYINPNNEGDQLKFRSKYWPMGMWIQSLAFYSFPNFADPTYFDYDEAERKPPPPLPPLQTSTDTTFSNEYMEGRVQSFERSVGEVPQTNSNNNGLINNSMEVQPTASYTEKNLVPVCFGGVFTTLWGQLSSDDAPVTPHGWKAITHGLSRFDNLEEGHYMERWWADLLSWSSYGSTINNGIPRKTGVVVSDDEQSKLLHHKKGHFGLDHFFAGVVVLNESSMKIMSKLAKFKVSHEVMGHPPNK